MCFLLATCGSCSKPGFNLCPAAASGNGGNISSFFYLNIYLSWKMHVRSNCVFDGCEIATGRHSLVPVIDKIYARSIFHYSFYWIAFCLPTDRVAIVKFRRLRMPFAGAQKGSVFLIFRSCVEKLSTGYAPQTFCIQQCAWISGH